MSSLPLAHHVCVLLLLSLSDPSPVSPPPQRERFSYTRYQLELMNGIFIHIRYPNSMQKQLIAKRVGITRDQVKVSRPDNVGVY